MADNLSRRRERGGDEDGAGSRVTFFAVGAVVGAVAALLFAPKSGRELREDLADATRKGVDRARETGTQLGARAGEYYDAASERARELASRRGESISAAIEAGREAYREEKRRTESSVMLPPSGGGDA